MSRKSIVWGAAGLAGAALALSLIFVVRAALEVPMADSGQILISKEHIQGGYLATLDPSGRIIGAGRSVEAGDIVGLALSARSTDRITGTIAITDALGRKVMEVPDVAIRRQKANNNEPWRWGQGFSLSGRFQIPAELDSGVYFVADDVSLYFVVRRKHDGLENSGHRRMAILISSNTFNAYSTTQKHSLYRHPIAVPEVSFLRTQNKTKPHEWKPFVEWMLADQPFGPDLCIEYITDFEMDDPNALAGISVLIVVGHSEYWSRKARETFDDFVNNGGDAMILSGNTMWWQVRYGDADKTRLISYKSDWIMDPMVNTPLETNGWAAPELDYPIYASIGADFRRGGFGVFRRPKEAKGWGGYYIVDANHPLMLGTGLKSGGCLPFYHLKEYDGAPILGFNADGIPVPDHATIGAHRYEILGFDLGSRGGEHTLGTMVLMQRTPTSGLVFNLAAKDFALTFEKKSIEPYGKSTEAMKKIFANFVAAVFADESPFSGTPQSNTVAIPMITPLAGSLPANLRWLKEKPDCGHDPT